MSLMHALLVHLVHVYDDRSADDGGGEENDADRTDKADEDAAVALEEDGNKSHD